MSVTSPSLVATPGALALAREVLQIEAQAVAALTDRIDGDFSKAVDLLLACAGRVVVSGVGKSGHIARKIAATLASTGTPSMFVHAAEAAHGDLGMITRDDVLLALSYSGEGDELLTMLPIAKRQGTPLIAITGNSSSALAKLADVHIDVRVEKEACPLNLAPTSSTTAMLAMGDALAIACLDARGFGPEDFARAHPGGALGRKLLTYVRDVMRTDAQIPIVGIDASVMDALHEITRKQIGVTAVVDAEREAGGHLHRRRPAAAARARRRRARCRSVRCDDARPADDLARQSGGRGGAVDGAAAQERAAGRGSMPVDWWAR